MILLYELCENRNASVEKVASLRRNFIQLIHKLFKYNKYNTNTAGMQRTGTEISPACVETRQV